MIKWNIPKNIFKKDFVQILNSWQYEIFPDDSIILLNDLVDDIYLGKNVEIILNVGLWVSEKWWSLLIPSYITWILDIFKRLNLLSSKKEFKPKIRIHTWLQEAILYNWINKEKSFKASVYNLYVIKEFIKTYFWELENFIFFDIITDWLALESYVDNIFGTIWNWLKDSSVVEAIEKLKKMWEKHWWEKWKENSLKYAISHSFWLRDIDHNISFMENSNWDETYYISFWWSAEKNFNIIRNHVSWLINSWFWDHTINKTIKMSTSKHEVPPYYVDWDQDLPVLNGNWINFDKLSDTRKKQLIRIIDHIWLDYELTWEQEIHKFFNNIKHKLVSEDFINIIWSFSKDFLEYYNLHFNNSDDNIMSNNNCLITIEEVELFLLELEKNIINRWFLPYNFDELKNTNEWKLWLMKSWIEEIIWEESLLEKLKSKKDLVIKYWIDPTWDEIHIWHLIPIKKLHLFEKLWYKIKFLIWTFTATIWDPDKKSMRPTMTEEQIKSNIETYISQIWKIIWLNNENVEIVYNKDWYWKWSAMDLLMLSNKWRLAKMLERKNFAERYEEWKSIAIWEMIYPLLQWWDSVELKADVELWWSDQKFNMLMWRELQEKEGMSQQTVITTSLLNGFDWRKMSKTFNNYVWIKPSDNIQEKVNNDYWKIMSMSDEMMIDYFQNVLSTSPEEIDNLNQILTNLVINPMKIKKMLARSILSLFYTEEQVMKSEENFKKIVNEWEIPKDINTFKLGPDQFLLDYNIIDIIAKFDNTSLSKSKIRGILIWWWVYINDSKITDINIKLKDLFDTNSIIIKYWKRKYFKIIN